MEKDKLKEYLGMLTDLEENILIQNNTIRQLQSKVDELKITTSFWRPEKPKEKSTDFVVVNMIGALILAFFGLWLRSFGVLEAFLGVLLIIGAVLWLFGSWGDWNAINYENAKREKHYEEELIKYEENLEIERKRVEQNTIKAAAYEHELALLMEKNQKSKETLDRLYSFDIVFPKYRNLPMLCTMYEYIAAGRVDTLEGADGAYNLLELEIRLDRIIIKLDEVIVRLGQIRDNQYMLYETMVEANTKTDTFIAETQRLAEKIYSLQQSTNDNAAHLSSELVALKQNSAANAYFAEQTAKELSYMNRMNYLTGKNDGVYFNVPPTL